MLTTTYMHAYYFVDEHWVYRGVPKEGLPACSSQTANGEEDGCLPYTWDEMTGLCPLSCSFVTVDLQMSSSGEFARASGVSGFFGEGGSYGALPPEDHGTYSIEPRGRISFNYADGHVVTETIAVMLNDGDSPDSNYGLLLGESAYFGPDSDVGS